MPSHHPAKAALYEVIAQVAQATANPHRLELLDLLVQAPRSVEQLAELSALSIANTSQHLQRLKRAGLVSSERRGASIWYRIAAPAVARRRCARARLRARAPRRVSRRCARGPPP